MTTLTETAIFSRKFLIWVISGIGLIIILVLLLTLGGTIKNILLPPKPPPATVAFGKLARLDLSEGIKSPVGITYSVETIKGELPSLPSTIKVFAIQPEESSFGALERTKITVAKIGFNQNPKEISGNTVKFQDTKEEDRILTIDIASGNFQLESNYLNNPEIISSRPKSIDEAIEIASTFFSNFNINKNDFPKEKVDTFKYRLDGISLTETPALSTANLVEVNFKRADLDNISVVSPQEKQAPLEALVSKDKVVKAQLSQLFVKKNEFSTYPLKGTNRAFEDLKAGRGTFNKNLKGTTFPIRDVTIAYLETKNPQEFLQPVYVFKSDEGLAAYVAAVDDVWVKD